MRASTLFSFKKILNLRKMILAVLIKRFLSVRTDFNGTNCPINIIFSDEFLRRYFYIWCLYNWIDITWLNFCRSFYILEHILYRMNIKISPFRSTLLVSFLLHYFLNRLSPWRTDDSVTKLRQTPDSLNLASFCSD